MSSMKRFNQLLATFIAENQVDDSDEKQQKVVNVCVTGAAGNIAYSLLFMIARGGLLGKNVKIELRLLDIPIMKSKIKGVGMELQDCSFPLVTKIVGTTSYETAFKDVDVVLLVGAKPRGPGMVRADLLKANAAIFAGQGKALNKYASPNVKVAVVGNPANTNAYITMINAPDIPKENFTALTRLDQNRAVGQISEKTGVPTGAIKNIIIWGNHSATQYPDVNHAIVKQNGLTTSVKSVVNDDEWIEGKFIKTVQQRGKAIIQARKLSSAASAANAVLLHVRDWLVGTPKGEWVNMAVPSDGSYGIPKNIIYSFPVTCDSGKWTIVQGLKISQFSKEKMQATAKELLDERTAAVEHLKSIGKM